VVTILKFPSSAARLLSRDGSAICEHYRICHDCPRGISDPDPAFHRLETGGDVTGIGIGLQDVLALDVAPAERAVGCGV
jgi:hypothetical protein